MDIGPALAGNIKLPLPKPFSGKYEDWDEWSWTFKTYLNMMEPSLAPYLSEIEGMPLPIEDKDLTVEGNETQTRTRLVFSRKLHYLLALITEDSAKLLVRQNDGGNGFETWRLLCHKFTLPGAAKDVGLLSKIMNFVFKAQDFEKDFDQWENLKKKYERQTKSLIPDSVLIALLLGKTEGALLTHLRLNLANLKTYETLRDEILSYHKSTQILKQDGKGSTPMEVDALIGALHKKGYYVKGKGKGKGKKGKGKGSHFGGGYFKGKGKKGKGGNFNGNFGYSKGKGKGKGKGGFTSKGKKGSKGLGKTSTSSDSGKGQGVNALESESTGSETLQQTSFAAGEESWNTSEWEDTNWFDDSDWYDTSQNFEGWISQVDDSWTWADNSSWDDWTWTDDSSGYYVQGDGDTLDSSSVVSYPTTAVNSVTSTLLPPPGLPEPTRSVNSNLSKGSRPPAAGLFMAGLIATLATVGNACMIGTTSVVTCDRYFDDPLLHEDLIANFVPDEQTVLFDSGASVHCCPPDFASNWPILPLHGVRPNLRSVTGNPITVHGKRVVGLSLNDTVCYLQFYVCDVNLPVVSVSRLLSQGFTTLLSPNSLQLTAPDGTQIDILRKGPMFYLQPQILDFDQTMFDTVCNGMIKQLHVAATLTNTKNNWDHSLVAPTTETQTSVKKPIFYHADRWALDLKENTLTRIHKRPRKTMFVPLGTKDMPIELDKLAEQRTTFVEYQNGEKVTLSDLWRTSDDPTKVLKADMTWTGKTVFKLLAEQDGRRFTKKTSLRTTFNTEPEVLEQSLPATSSTSKLEDAKTSTPLAKNLLFGTEEFKTYVTKLWDELDPITKTLRTTDYWLYLPTCWIRFHYEPLKHLFVPSSIDTKVDFDRLGRTRLTLMFDKEGKATWNEDTWQEDEVSKLDVPHFFTGATCFPLVPKEVVLDAEPAGDDFRGQKPKTLSVPLEPSAEERTIHELTHLPFRSWCKYCVQAKSKQSHSHTIKESQPVIQVDYSYLSTELDPDKSVTLLTATDVLTKLSMTCVVPKKGKSRYAQAELKRFVFETGRTFGIIQHDAEASLQALVEAVLTDLGGLSRRTTPVGWKQASGSVGNAQQTLFGQVRTLTLQVKNDYSLDIPVTSIVYPWLVKHAQWTLNHFMQHADGKTSFERRWGRPYTHAVCRFLETVLFRKNTKTAKGSPAWIEGLWVGRDTESNEHLILTSEGAWKTRNVRRLPPTGQANKGLAETVTGLPWNPTSNKKDADVGTFVFVGQSRPTSSTSTGVGTDPEAPETEETKAEEDQEVQEAKEQEDVELEEPKTPRDKPTRPLDDYDPSNTPSRRRRITRDFGSPKRILPLASETVDVEEAKSKHLRVSAVTENLFVDVTHVCNVQLKTGIEVPVFVNQDEGEAELELVSKEPLIWYETELPLELVEAGMKKEMSSIKDFDVYEEVLADTVPENALKTAIPTIWVHRAKGLEVKSRLVVQGYKQVIADKDDTYASTPSFVTLKLLLTLAIAKSWFVLGGDVSTAFLHADWVGEDILVFPPAEFYPQGGVLWRLRKALYGLKNSPKLWQDHFASVLERLNFIRCKTDANLYRHQDEELYVLCYVDDLLVFGEESKVRGTFSALKQELLLKETGTLSKVGDKLDFLGRKLERTCESILVTMDQVYIEKILAEADMTKCRLALTPGVDSLRKKIEEEEPLDKEQHSYYRRTVGQLLWLCPVRPDVTFAVKELSRGVSAPTSGHLNKLRHLLRYLYSTKEHKVELRPKVLLDAKNTCLNVTCYADSDWAGCTATRKSTSGVLCSVLGSTICTISRTQQTLALSSGEAELYALGLGIAESLFIRSLILESNLATTCKILVFTDSTAGKSMATRFGTTRKTKHIELRYLYMQELVVSGLVIIKKVLGTNNPADILTKYVSKDVLHRHLNAVGIITLNPL